MGERGVRNAEVEGSIPFSSTKLHPKKSTDSINPLLSIPYKSTRSSLVQKSPLTARGSWRPSGHGRELPLPVSLTDITIHHAQPGKSSVKMLDGRGLGPAGAPGRGSGGG